MQSLQPKDDAYWAAYWAQVMQPPGPPRKRLTRRVGRPMRGFRTVEREYLRAIYRLIAETKRAAMKDLLPRLSGVVRQDDLASEVEEALSDFAKRFSWPPSVVARLVGLFVARMNQVHDKGFEDQMASMGRVPGIDISGQSWALEGMRLYAANNRQLVESLGADVTARVQKAVLRHVVEGRRAEELEEVLDRQFQVVRSRAATIARTETGKLQSAMDQARQTAAGFDKYEWSTSLDERVRPSHQRMEGTVHSWSERPLVGKVHVHPGEDVNCRCVALPVDE